MPDLDLKVVNRYIVQRTRAAQADAATAPEAEVARKGMAEIAALHSDIDARANAIVRILEAPPAPFGMPFRVPGAAGEKKPAGPAPSGWKDRLAEGAARLAEASAAHLADGLVMEVTGAAGAAAARMEKLKRGDVLVDVHPCAPGDVCIEIRCTAADIRSVCTDRKGRKPIDEILARVEDVLVEEAG